ncbi:hypothetical protein [Afifella sp. IM 167]|uniref:COG3904 family protein n=1 Tax=Afifella sp. IM 167 TaxID=2033586 RepID=UPI001CCCAD7F|nr:hypothetical protein [Afifella sp. IM 167]MBZ8134724.1 hypothetical protein [Afifella sp. IM 167]
MPHPEAEALPGDAADGYGQRPGLTARLKALPEGSILRLAFYGLIGLTVMMVGFDLYAIVEERRTDPFASPARAPVTMSRPAPGDQVRPYLPMTRPVAPGARETPSGVPYPRKSFQEAEPMRFQPVGEDRLLLQGTIVPGTAGEFERYLADHPLKEGAELLLHSPGGSVADAIAMARKTRELGLHTRVAADGYCASSCPLLFAGGVERHADETAWIGVHQIYALKGSLGTLADGMDQAQRVSAEAQELLVDFGVDPRVWIRAMQTPKDRLYLFTPEELAEYDLVTGPKEGDKKEPKAS